MSQEQRIVDLEVRAAFQDKLISDLDEVVREFSKRVENLERQLKDLKDTGNAEPIGPPNEPPPHY